MILKELDPHTATDPFSRAGRRAEETLAHYLRRAFAGREDVWVYNGLRLERGDDAAQIDHLIVHTWGMIIVESKSVTTKVKINEHGEWQRLVGGHFRGMASPIQQAKRQGEFLRAYLQDHREQLRGKYLLGMQQGGFANMPLDVLVAISDDAVIQRPRKPELPEVHKADVVAGQVLELLARYRRINTPFNFNSKDVLYDFRKEEIDRILPFLLAHHRPLTRSELRNGSGDGRRSVDTAPENDQPIPTGMRGLQVLSPPLGIPDSVSVVDPSVTSLSASDIRPREVVSAQPNPGVSTTPPEAVRPEVDTVGAAGMAPEATFRCRSCAGDRLVVTWGRYGYYFKCAACQGNTPIRQSCATCGGREKIRKDADTYFAGCEACGTSHLFFIYGPTDKT